MISGLPKLPKLSTKGSVLSILGNVQANLWALLTGGYAWGVFEAGSETPAVDVDSVAEMSFRSESQVSDYRVATGSFATYNKVQVPFELPFILTRGGTQAEREAFLDWLKDNQEKPTLFDIVTPEKVFKNVTLSRFTFERKSDAGAGMIVAECVFTEVREAPLLYYSTKEKAADTSEAQDAGDKPAEPPTRTDAKPTTKEP